MTIRKGRHLIAALAFGGISAATALFGSGAASASLIDDMAPLMTTKCSFTQFDTALRDMEPAVAAKLDADPTQKVILQTMLAQPSSQRQAAFEMLSQNFSQITAMKVAETTTTDIGVDANADARAAIRKVATACDRY
ncbi:hemophore-related protein [Nocardia tenerifensis]|uniref:Hemophore-related protein n=1 Tax=Nocardia tenerifensis TaxID=228006 RepID=A0A318K8N7_9NOCA|nr:hypothetical protein [Nocardia tenerifensis]PXX66868.1 hemophore-related protein [Nocardia tenerifensis]